MTILGAAMLTMAGCGNNNDDMLTTKEFQTIMEAQELMESIGF